MQTPLRRPAHVLPRTYYEKINLVSCFLCCSTFYLIYKRIMVSGGHALRPHEWYCIAGQNEFHFHGKLLLRLMSFSPFISGMFPSGTGTKLILITYLQVILPALLISHVQGFTFKFTQPPLPLKTVPTSQVAQDRVLFDLDPEDIFTKWGPFGYFNQYFDPANSIGPEILRGFGSPFAPYNGFQLLETITAPPLKVPDEATTTASPYPPDMFEDSAGTPKNKEKPMVPPTTSQPSAAAGAPVQPAYDNPPALPPYQHRPINPAQYQHGRPLPGPNSFGEAYGNYHPMGSGQPYSSRGPPSQYYGGQQYRRNYRPNPY